MKGPGTRRGRGGYRGSGRESNISNRPSEKEEVIYEDPPEYEEDNDDEKKGKARSLLSVINNKLLGKLEIRPKKARVPVNKTFLQLKRKRKGKIESDFQGLLNVIYKANAKTIDQIKEALAKNGRFIKNPDTERFIEALANTKVSNQKIQLSANTSNIPLYTYQSFIYPDVGIISNDILYLWGIFISSVSHFADEDILKIVSSAKFVDVQIVSQLFDGNSEIDRGYAQDFTGDCCVLNLEKKDKEIIKAFLNPFTVMTEEERQKIKMNDPENEKRFNDMGYNEETGISSFEFEYNGITYFTSADADSCLIFPENMKLEEVVEKVNGTVIFHDEKGKFELYAKSVPTKDKPRFISCRVKGDNFCPCFMKFEKAITCNYLYRVKLDNNRLFAYWDKQMKNEGVDIIRPRNVLYWDNIEGFFDFLQIYVITSQYKELCDKFKDCLDMYYEHKTAIMFWKQNQLEYQRILYEFFNSFNTKLNYDKLMKLYNRIKKYIETRALLMNDKESYGPITKLFNKLGRLCDMINNQFTSEVMFIADRMQDLLEQLDQGVLQDPEDLRKLGYAIYCCSYADESGINPAFPFVFAPGAFLGNIKEGIEKTPKEFTELISDFKKSMRTIKKTNKETVDLITNAIETSADNRDTAIENTFKYFLNDNGMVKLMGDKKLYDTMLDEIKKNVNLNNELRKYVTQSIITSIIGGEKPKEIILYDDDELYNVFRSVIGKYNNNIEEINDVNQDELNELQKKKKEIQKQIDQKQNEIDKNDNKMIKPNESGDEEEEIEEENEEDEKEEKKKTKKKKDKKKSSSQENKQPEQRVLQQGVGQEIAKFLNEKYKLKNLSKFRKEFGDKGLPPSNVYAFQGKITKSYKSAKSALGFNKNDVVSKVTRPSEIYKKLKDINENRTYKELETEYEELMSDELKSRLKIWYLTALKNNGLDQLIGKTIFDVWKVAKEYKDFRDVLNDYAVEYGELLDQAFANDKFKLLEALNNLNKTGLVEQYKIDTNKENIEAKKKNLESLLVKLQNQ